MNQMAPIAWVEAPTGDIHDFDFLFGNWSVTNRRLKQRWVGSDDWDVFTGVQRCEPRLGGAAQCRRDQLPDARLLRHDHPPVRPRRPPLVDLLGQLQRRDAVPAGPRRLRRRSWPVPR